MSHFVGNQEITIDSITYHDKQEADHFLRRFIRTALGQRLLHTDSRRDKSLSVELPIELHNLKEKLTSFQEKSDFTYTKGLSEFLTEKSNRIHEVLNNTTPSQRCYVSVEKYKKAYSASFDAKIQEMKAKYPEFTEREKLMVYHAQVACIADQEDLERFQENSMSTSYLEKGVLGPHFKENINIAADLLRLNAKQRGSFIKTLAEKKFSRMCGSSRFNSRTT